MENAWVEPVAIALFGAVNIAVAIVIFRGHSLNWLAKTKDFAWVGLILGLLAWRVLLLELMGYTERPILR